MDKQKTFMSLCTGGAGADIGAQLAGYTPINGVEINPEIASVAHMNGFDCIIDDIRNVDYTQLEQPDWLHSSTPCINASIANSKKGETELDKELALAVCGAIIALNPDNFSLENVRGYLTFKAYQLIKQCLLDNGYTYIDGILNSADYGTPQTRHRLYLVASRINIPRMPQETHKKVADMFTDYWVGWHETIKDIIDTLPESNFTDGQINNLPINEKESLLNGSNKGIYLVSGGNTTSSGSNGRAMRNGCQPAFTVTSKSDRDRIYINSRTLKIQPRCLARFNGLPDTYLLPDNKVLAAKILGNMVMPLVMKAIIEVNNG